VTLHGRRLRSTLGGTGLAISAGCAQAELAAEYAAYVASPACQRTIYTFAGGQPGHRAAWLDEDANLHTHGYFRATLSTLDQAWLRPRYAGYLGLQERGAEVVHRWLVRGGDVEPALAELDRLYRESRNGEIVL
jgi:multiple sugar transport system substrate-binding protein